MNSFPFAALLLLFRSQGETIPDLVERLRSDTVEEREAAARALVARGKDAVPALRKLFRDSDLEVRARASETFDRIVTPKLRSAVPGAEERLDTPEDPAWTAVFLEAVGSGIPLARADLEPLAAPALRGAGTEAQAADVCRAIARRDLRSAIPALLARLGDPGASIRAEAADSIGNLEHWEALPAVAKLLGDGDRGVRTTALLVLDQGRVHDLPQAEEERQELEAGLEVPTPIRSGGGALGALVETLRSDDPVDRRSSAWLLLRAFPPVELTAALLPLLEDRSLAARAEAAGLLGELRAKDALAPLLSMIEDKDPRVRARAAGALGDLGAASAEPRLRPLLKDTSPPVRAAAAGALADIGARGAGADLAKLLEDPQPWVRGAAAAAVGALELKEERDRLAKCLKDEDPFVRGRAARALGSVGAATLASEPDAFAAACALESLAEAGRKDDLSSILPLLRRDNPLVRRAAARAAAFVGGPDAGPALLPVLNDPEEEVRAAAAEALARTRMTEAAASLAKLLTDRAPRVRLSAAAGLVRLGSRDGVVPLLEATSAGLEQRLRVSATPLERSCLNAIRRPDAWKTWSAKPLGRQLRGPRRAILEALAKEAGVTLEIGGGKDPEMASWLVGGLDVRGTNLLRALERVFARGTAEFVLEPDRLRILPHDEAVTLWRAWAKE